MADDGLRLQPVIPDDEPDYERPRVVVAYLMGGLLGVHVVGSMIVHTDINLPLVVVLVTGICTLFGIPFAFKGHE